MGWRPRNGVLMEDLARMDDNKDLWTELRLTQQNVGNIQSDLGEIKTELGDLIDFVKPKLPGIWTVIGGIAAIIATVALTAGGVASYVKSETSPINQQVIRNMQSLSIDAAKRLDSAYELGRQLAETSANTARMDALKRDMEAQRALMDQLLMDVASLQAME